MRAVAYFRYSTDNKQQVDNSEKRQRYTVEQVIHRRKWKLIDSYIDEAVSGGDDKPQLIELRKRVESKDIQIDVICVDDLSRLSRRPILYILEDIGWIKDNNIKVSIASVRNGEPREVDDLGLELSDIVDVWKNSQKILDTSRGVITGITRKMNDNDLAWLGRAPYGYDLKNQESKTKRNTLKKNKDLKIVRKIFKRFLAGDSISSLVEIFETLQRYKDDPSLTGNTTSVKNILRNSIYAGVRTFGVRGVGKYNTVHNKKRWVAESPLKQAYCFHEYKEEGFEPCITMEEYKRVQEILDRNQKSFKRYPQRHKHLYSGLLNCANCGTRMVAATWKRGDDRHTGLIRYQCPKSISKSKKCKCDDGPSRKAIRTDELEPLIQKKFGILLANPGFHKDNLRMLTEKIVQQNKSSIDFVRDDYELQSQRLTKLYQRMMDGDDSPELERFISEQKSRLDKIKDKIDAELEVDDVIAFARDQYEENNHDLKFYHYFGMMYQYATEIAMLTKAERYKAYTEYSKKLMRKARETVGPSRDKYVHSLPDDSKESGKLIESLVGNNDEDITNKDILSILLNMGLIKILVDFQLSIWRGKPRQVPTDISLVFAAGGYDKDGDLVAPQKHKGTHVVVRCNQVSLEQE